LDRVLRFDPRDPLWPNRDRFILSNGHASMLLWSMLHLTGTQAVNADYETVGKLAVSLEDIKRFRQLASKAPGHPEYHWVSGVETTTGPLGQGIATSVGMAIAAKFLASSGMHTFGASAPLKDLQRTFGFEPERVVAIAKELLGR
jgi:transketolase